MSDDWTNPSRARLAAEQRLDEAAAHDLSQAEILRTAHATFLHVVKGLEFLLHYPQRGYSLEDLSGALEAMAPMPQADYARLLDKEAAALLQETDDYEQLEAAGPRYKLRVLPVAPAVTSKSSPNALQSKRKRPPTPEELRRQPAFKFPIEGGRKSAAQAPEKTGELSLAEQTTSSRRRA